jgi:hypothetical protein
VLVIVRRQAAGGYLELVIAADIVELRCHWLLDLVENEWFDMESHYYLADYLLAIDDALSAGHGKARGNGGCDLTLTSAADGFEIQLSRPEDGWPTRSLQLHIARPMAELMRGLTVPGEPAGIGVVQPAS